MSPHTPVIEIMRLERLALKQRRKVLKLRERLADEEDILTALIQASVLSRAAVALPEEDSQDCDGEATEPEGQGVDDPSRRRTVASSGEPGRQPTESGAPGDPPAASAETLSPSGTAGTSSAGSGVSASREGDAVEASAPSAPEPRRGFSGGRSQGVTRGGSAFGRQAKDETGNRYGKLTVIERAPSVSTGARWRCGCDCGEERLVEGGALRAGRVVACFKCTPGARTCSVCGEPGHNTHTCPTVNPAAIPVGRTVKLAPKSGDCPKCFSMPSRVEGERCAVCRLEAERPVRATDFTSGESPLGRAS